MPLESQHNDVKQITVVQFVESLSSLFDLGTQQAEKLSLAKSFGTKQDRYALLDGEQDSPLVDALVGRSVVLNDGQNEVAPKLVREFLAYIQQLISWMQASLVHEAIDQEDLNIAVSRLFGTPQLMMLICALLESDLLKDSSPLKQVPQCMEALVEHDFDPIHACKALLRLRIQERLYGRTPPSLAFLKHINSLDWRSAPRPSTQRLALKNLNTELINVPKLTESERHALIDELTGIYAAMMALHQLRRRTNERHPQFFPSVVRQLQADFREAFGAIKPSRRLTANHDLFLLMLNADDPRRLTATILNTPSFRMLLDSNASFSSKGLPDLLRDFLREGMTPSWNKSRLLKANSQLNCFTSKPFFNGVHSFMAGLLALSEHAPGAQIHFEHCLDASERWPLGPFRSQAALFLLGLKLAQKPTHSPNVWNPLLSTYLDALPQEFKFWLKSDEQETVEMYNLRELIGKYNSLVWALSGAKGALMVNPFKKIDTYLQKIFDEVEQSNSNLTAETLAKISIKSTTKRDLERVKSDFYGTPLNRWLEDKHLGEMIRSFPDPDMWQLVPAIERYMNLQGSIQKAIASASAQSQFSLAQHL
ncbi:hypothetical protein V0R37_13620 [Pollutimonas sp. H1-120]|uniref:hypothetical protein n=1 Tax=Pollutimonas sp. H1-120 TaxID=3148824 RepID=UPI003B5267F6